MSTIREQSVSATATETEDDATQAQAQTEEDANEVANSLALSIFTAVAEREGHSNVQLYDHLDIEALDQLLGHAHESPDSEWELTFAVEDSKVTVRSDGSFTVV